MSCLLEINKMTVFVSLTKGLKKDSFHIDDKYEDAVRNLLVTLEIESENKVS